jgi:DNA-directed RNA polymerase specialized sigma24 family protein
MNANSEELDEYTLAVRARDGDRNALSELVTRLRGPLFAAAYSERRHYEDARDAVADAVLRICRNIGGLRDPAQARAWMLRIARNEARRLRPTPLPLPEGTPSSPGPPSLLRLDVERALRSLPADTASAVALFYLDGLGVREIAARLDRPEGTVKYWLHRGRTRLHQALEGYAPMTNPMNPVPPPVAETPWNAAIVSSDLLPEQLRAMTAEMQAAGWNEIHHLSHPAVLGRGANGGLPEALTDCQCIVLDEFVGGRSAFELSVLWRSTEAGRRLAILLLIAGRDRPAETENTILASGKAFSPSCFIGDRPAETENTILAAYLAGFDMLLTKPYAPGEIESFTRRIRQVQEETAHPVPVAPGG